MFSLLNVGFYPQLTGDTLASSTHVEAIKDRCQTQVMRDTTLWDKTDDGDILPPKAFMDVMCPLDCLDRGQCVQGL